MAVQNAFWATAVTTLDNSLVTFSAPNFAVDDRHVFFLVVSARQRRPDAAREARVNLAHGLSSSTCQLTSSWLKLSVKSFAGAADERDAYVPGWGEAHAAIFLRAWVRAWWVSADLCAARALYSILVPPQSHSHVYVVCAVGQYLTITVGIRRQVRPMVASSPATSP
jgi:hypothetical protein